MGAWLIEHNLNYNEGSRFIGNFHHHRFQLIKELEELLKLDRYSSGLNELFGEGQQAGLSLDLTYKNLLPADSDHMRVFESVNAKNTVIQGPPGTGKSQVLSNLISKLLNTDKTVVVVSEKRSALEIIPKKLSPYALDRLLSLIHI